MTFPELEANIGNELFYLTTDNLPGDLTGYVPPQGQLTGTRVNRVSDGDGSVVTRTAVIDGKTTEPQLVFDNLPDAYSALAVLYKRLRAGAVADAGRYVALRDAAIALAGG